MTHSHFLRTLVIIVAILAFIALAMNIYNPHIPVEDGTQAQIEAPAETAVEFVPVTLSATQLILNKGEAKDVLLSIENKYEEQKEYSIVLDCTDYQGTGCTKLVASTQVKFIVPAKQKASTPITLRALSDIQEGTYELYVSVRQDDKTYGKEQLFIQVK
ncbi:hypothetical protein KY336_04680 [Candidatus Woesearchaeota archaeon]|nr:hypothetical protein [Candidatus Woesearchaeota archaeon]